jgi:branched-chain amino acid transport system permease protein
MRGRPELYTRYEDDQAILNTPAKRVWLVALLVFAVLLSFNLSNNLHTVFAQAFAAAIGAIGLNLVSGYAGQVSLGHAFFIGLGAYTAAVVGDTGTGTIHGFGIDNMLVWLPLAGLVPAVVGYVIAPIATRLRGLYLAIVTLGLVFLGEHAVSEWRSLTGGQGLGRKALRGGPSCSDSGSTEDGEVFGVFLAASRTFYLLALVLLVLFAVPGAQPRPVRRRGGHSRPSATATSPPRSWA